MARRGRTDPPRSLPRRPPVPGGLQKGPNRCRMRCCCRRRASTCRSGAGGPGVSVVNGAEPLRGATGRRGDARARETSGSPQWTPRAFAVVRAFGRSLVSGLTSTWSTVSSLLSAEDAARAGGADFTSTWCSSRTASSSHTTAAARSAAVLPRLAVSSRHVRAPFKALGGAQGGREIDLSHPTDGSSADAQQVADPLLRTRGAEQRARRQVTAGACHDWQRQGLCDRFHVHHPRIRHAQIVPPIQRPTDFELTGIHAGHSGTCSCTRPIIGAGRLQCVRTRPASAPGASLRRGFGSEASSMWMMWRYSSAAPRSFTSKTRKLCAGIGAQRGGNNETTRQRHRIDL